MAKYDVLRNVHVKYKYPSSLVLSMIKEYIIDHGEEIHLSVADFRSFIVGMISNYYKRYGESQLGIVEETVEAMDPEEKDYLLVYYNKYFLRANEPRKIAYKKFKSGNDEGEDNVDTD